MESPKKSKHRGLKICSGITALLLITVLVVLVVLFLTVLKPKDPKIWTQSVTLDHLEWVVFPVSRLDVSLGIEVTIDNPNYGSFKYDHSTAYVTYHGDVVAEAVMEGDTIPSRAKHNISTILNVSADKLMSNANFSSDYGLGSLNFTSTSTLHGKVSMWKVINMKAISFCTCEISVFVLANTVYSVCKSKLKL